MGVLPIRLQEGLPSRHGEHDRHHLHPRLRPIDRDVDGWWYTLWDPLGSLPDSDDFLRRRDLPNGT